ncbi:MAG: hypothetical protein FJ253_03565 [Phycisphaerae bacterium]|nr:hypothetical protein [Phycisphaerae bacterium]
MWCEWMSRAVAVAALAAENDAPRGAGSLAVVIGAAVLGAIVVVAIASFLRPVHLAIGFGATVAMWAIGYAAMTSPGLPAGEVLFLLMLVCVGAAGTIAAGRGGAARSGLAVGLISAGANLLIVGSLLGGRASVTVEVERDGAVQRVPLFAPSAAAAASSVPLGLRLADDGRIESVAERSGAHDAGLRPGDRILGVDGRPLGAAADLATAAATASDRRERLPQRAALWAAGLFVVSGALGWLGGLVGTRRRSEPIRDPAALMAIVAAVAVLLLLVTGGLVTGMEAGLAVPDWPNSFGHNMLLYPISEMKGGVYWEHAHRLFGMLVGVTMLVLVPVVFRCDGRMWARTLVIWLLLAVVVQGWLGAMRVTGSLSISEHRADHAPNLALAIVHGVLGQGIFAGSLLLAAMLGSTWRTASAAREVPGGGTMRGFSSVLLVLMVLQLVLGACYRHLLVPPTADHPGSSPMWALHSHLTLAAVIMVLALLAGFRAKALGRDSAVPVVPGLGRLLHIIVGVQILFGIGALVAVLTRAGAAIPAWEIVVTTAHQATGAILLGVSLLLAAWSFRLIRAPRQAGA